jgi:hypothetical protein
LEHWRELKLVRDIEQIELSTSIYRPLRREKHWLGRSIPLSGLGLPAAAPWPGGD